MKFFSRVSLKSVSFNFVGFYGETLPVAVISMLITKIKTSTAKWVFQLHNVFIILPTSITIGTPPHYLKKIEAILCDFIFCRTALKSILFSVADFICRMVNKSHVSR